MAKRLFCCGFGLYLELDSAMFEIEKTSTGGTEFFIEIFESFFIDNVYLVVNGQYIQATHYLRGYYDDEFKKTGKKIFYSIFHARYSFSVPCEKMEVHFCYRLNWSKVYVTASNYFIVEPYFKQNEKEKE